MEKMLCIKLCLGFLLSGCSSYNSEKMSIKESIFSKETQNALLLFRDEIQYFDISFDKQRNRIPLPYGLVSMACGVHHKGYGVERYQTL